MNYEAVIGLEVHAQLRTDSKLFCACATAFGAPVNAQTCAVCLGMPGVLPVVNARAVEQAVQAALGLGCTVHRRSQWSRKNYFYADLAKGYQISQYDQPLATNGHLDISTHQEGGQGGERRRVAIARIHIEEDAGKNVHDDALAGGRSYVDFNRAGVPLVEIVSEPVLHSAAEAAAYMRTLRQVLRYLGVCDGNMEEGSLRCDANVSIRPVGQTTLGTRTELKNINSFKFVQQAIAFEILRQTEVVQGGGEVVLETRLWDAASKQTRPMRSKEQAHDYRYFPDPDLPDLVLEDGLVDQISRDLPELPDAKRNRYVSEMGLSAYDADVLLEDRQVAGLFEEAVAISPHPKAIANWVLNELLREAKGAPITALKVGGRHIGELVALIEDGTISGKIAKDVFARMCQSGDLPQTIVAAQGLTQLTDSAALEPIVDDIIDANPKSVAQFHAGKENVIGFFVGQVMRATSGKANPSMVNALLRSKLAARKV